jgi:hypothetical protein
MDAFYGRRLGSISGGKDGGSSEKRNGCLLARAVFNTGAVLRAIGACPSVRPHVPEPQERS